MTAQRIMSNSLVAEKYAVVQEAMQVVATKAGLRRLVWICEICGMVHLATPPSSCEGCGASGALTLQQDTRSQVSCHH